MKRARLEPSPLESRTPLRRQLLATARDVVVEVDREHPAPAGEPVAVVEVAPFVAGHGLAVIVVTGDRAMIESFVAAFAEGMR